jgi:putative PIN family toxin of toxin-antitoxin system
VVDVVFDAVVFVRCLIYPASRWGRLVFAPTDRYRLIVSEPILREILEVLSRPAITRKFRTIEGLDKAALLARLADATVVNVADVPPIARDPKDDPYLETARAAGASFLITEDQDLLVIGSYEGTRIVDTATFLSILDEEQRPGASDE